MLRSQVHGAMNCAAQWPLTSTLKMACRRSALKRIRASNGAIGGETLALIGRWGGLAVAILGLLILAIYIIAGVSGVLNNSTTSTP